MKTTLKHLRNLAARLDHLSQDLGLTQEGESTHLQEGSKYNGRAFRLVLLQPSSTAHHRHPLGDYLGMTKPETEGALGHLVTALNAVKYSQH